MRVTVAYADPAGESLIEVTLPLGATVADAVAASDVIARHALDPVAIAFAIFGRRALGGTPLLDGDRVEVTRPLLADPKDTRRRRARASRPTPAKRQKKEQPGAD